MRRSQLCGVMPVYDGTDHVWIMELIHGTVCADVDHHGRGGRKNACISSSIPYVRGLEQTRQCGSGCLS